MMWRMGVAHRKHCIVFTDTPPLSFMDDIRRFRADRANQVARRNLKLVADLACADK